MQSNPTTIHPTFNYLKSQYPQKYKLSSFMYQMQLHFMNILNKLVANVDKLY